MWKRIEIHSRKEAAENRGKNFIDFFLTGYTMYFLLYGRPQKKVFSCIICLLLKHQRIAIRATRVFDGEKQKKVLTQKQNTSINNFLSSRDFIISPIIRNNKSDDDKLNKISLLERALWESQRQTKSFVYLAVKLVEMEKFASEIDRESFEHQKSYTRNF